MRPASVPFGGGYSREFPVGESLQASVMPSAYATLRRTGMVPIGWIAGLEAHARLFDRCGLFIRPEYGHVDIVEHVAKWKAGGFRASLGAELRIEP